MPITPGDGPYAGVEHGERGDFTAGQHLVADRDLDDAARLDHPFVDALEARGRVPPPITAADGSTKTTTDGVATWTGGTGRYQTVRGIERDHTLVDWAKGESKPTAIHGSADGEYWFEK